MAIASTLYRFQIELADIDRSVYETLDLRVPCHPSEDEERLVVRVLARAIHHEEDLEFGRGLSNAEDAALWIKSHTGDVKLWIDIGMPSAERLHRASKHAAQVCVYTNKHDIPLRKEWSSRKIHKAETVQVVRLPTEMVRELAAKIERTNTWYLTIQDGSLSVAYGDGEHSLDGAIERTTMQAFLATS
jgi:uncharacterized protein YaeQ